jgi:dTMP kinase
MKGLFIVIEGIDGAGLSTQASLLCQWLKNRGKAILTKEPTNGLIGGLIKAVLKHEWKTDQKALQLLFSADRAHHLANEIIPALENGFHVVCDRYILSTLCYGNADGIDLDWLRSLNSKFLKPDITIILDVPPEVSLQRMKRARGKKELFEEVEKLKNIRENYLKLKDEFPNTFVVDATKKIEEVHEEIKRKVEKFLK